MKAAVIACLIATLVSTFYAGFPQDTTDWLLVAVIFLLLSIVGILGEALLE